MATTLLFGHVGDGAVYRYGAAQTADDATPVTLRATSQLRAPDTWWGESLWRVAVVLVSANVGCTVQLTMLLDGVAYDGTLGHPDTRATFTIPTPAAGERVTTRTLVGLWLPLVIDGVTRGRVGARGTWIQLQLDTIGAITVPDGETNPDLRFDGLELIAEPLLDTQQVSNA